MSHKAVTTQSAPAAIGPYSQAVAAGPWLFCSGQLGLDPAHNNTLAEGIEAQTRQVLANLVAVLAAAGATPGQVVKTTIFLKELGHFAQVNQLYAEVFGAPFPARSTVQVAALPKDGLVEIEAVALI